MHNTFQTNFFDQILQKFPKKSQAVEELSDLLSVGKDAIYRRLRGDTLLTPDELKILALKYHISLDAMIYDTTNTVFCNYNAFTQKVTNFQQYLEGILAQMHQVSQLPDSYIHYASVEIPLFYYMYYPELIAFKLYVWGSTTWNFEYLDKRKFSTDLLSYPTLQLNEELYKTYNTLPSTELWSLGILDNTLNQIEYISVIDRFEKPSDALLLCDVLTALMQHLKSMAKHGHKFSPKTSPHTGGGSFDLYHNELYSTNNTIFASTIAGQMMFTTYCNPNFLTSTDPRICEFTADWFKTIISKSNAISTHSDKGRNWFFSRLERKIKAVRNRIEVQLEEF